MSQFKVNELIRDEIARISEAHQIDLLVLETFTQFVIENYKKKDSSISKKLEKKIKPLTLTQLKEAVYEYFGVKNTTDLKRSGSFKMATDGMGNLNLSVKPTWEMLYRKFVGVIPGEENQQGYGCINGINVFNYFMPWEVFGLDPRTATKEDIKQAYRNLSKVFHPDVPKTGDAPVFDRLNTMYKSLTAAA